VKGNKVPEMSLGTNGNSRDVKEKLSKITLGCKGQMAEVTLF
jgi:hypothetical protein